LPSLVGTVFNPGVLMGIPKQDCIGFNNGNLQAKSVSGSWKIVDGDHWLLDFGSNEEEALKSLNVLQAYGFTQHCFVGRPNPPFDYWLAGDTAASGGAGEDCIAFNNANIEAKQVSGSWKVVDGSSWLFDFGSKKAQAQDAAKLIKFHGFTKTCYVGRPGPSLTYLLK